MRLEDKIAVVTGVGGRIGGIVALAYAGEGAHVVAVDEDQDNALAVAAQVKDLGRRSLALEVDVTNKAAVEELVRRAVDEFGGVDILFNGTGVSHNQAFLTFKEADFDHAMAVGLKAFFLTCQAVGRQMAEQGRRGQDRQPLLHRGQAGLRRGRRLVHHALGRGRHDPGHRPGAGLLRRQRELPGARRHGVHPLPP